MIFSMNRKPSLLATILLVAIAFAGCSGMGTNSAKSWKLPVKENAESAMIVGRIGLAGNKPMAMRVVTYQLWGKSYSHSGSVPRGEEEFIMDNGYFVIPNIKPGRYWFSGFYAYGFYNSVNTMPTEKNIINVKPGEIRFVGSFDYNNDGSSFSLIQAERPSELEIMQWLSRAGNGTGWESAIRQHIKTISGAKT